MIRGHHKIISFLETSSFVYHKRATHFFLMDIKKLILKVLLIIKTYKNSFKKNAKRKTSPMIY